MIKINIGFYKLSLLKPTNILIVLAKINMDYYKEPNTQTETATKIEKIFN